MLAEQGKCREMQQGQETQSQRIVKIELPEVYRREQEEVYRIDEGRGLSKKLEEEKKMKTCLSLLYR